MASSAFAQNLGIGGASSKPTPVFPQFNRDAASKSSPKSAEPTPIDSAAAMVDWTGVSVSCSLATPTVALGETALVCVTVRVNGQVPLFVDAVEPPGASSVNLVAQSSTNRSEGTVGGMRSVSEYRYLFMGTATGAVTLGAPTVRMRHLPTGQTQSFPGSSLTLNFGAAKRKIPWRSIGLTICAVGLLAGLSNGLRLWHRRSHERRRRAAEPPPPPPKTPLESLHDDLRALHATARENPASYCLDIAARVRRYALEAHPALRAEMDTATLLDTLRRESLPLAYLASLERILNQSDQIKFARHAPSNDEVAILSSDALQFVESAPQT